MASSYIKIVEETMRTPHVEEYLAVCKRRIASARIGEVKFQANSHFPDRAMGSAQLLLGTDKETIEHWISQHSNAGSSAVHISTYMLMVEKEVQKIVGETFGVRRDPRFQKLWVPTYNLKNQTSKVVDNLFHAIRERLDKETEEARTVASDKLTAEIREVFGPSSEEKRKRAVEDYAVMNIRETLLRFKHANQETLKRALDEFIVHELCDSLRVSFD